MLLLTCLQTTDFVEPVGASSVANRALALLDGGSGPSKQTVNEDKRSPDRELFVDEDAMSVSEEDEPNGSDDPFLNAGEDLDSEDDFVETDAESDLSFVVPDDASLYPDKDISPSKNKGRAVDTPEVVTASKPKSKPKSIPKSKAKAIGKVAVSILIGSAFMFCANLLGLLLGLCRTSLVRFR
jgi:hypothetical protein